MMDELLWEKRFKAAQINSFKPKQIVWKKIRRINLEPTTSCNASCIICDHDNYFKKFGKIDIPIEDAKSFLDRICKMFPHVKKVNFGVYCEPLMYPHIIELINHASKLLSHIKISTNLSLLDGEMSKNLLEGGLTDINLSIDECNKERFEKIRKGMKWELIFNNAYEFKQLRDKGRYNCAIVVNPVLCDENRMWMKDITKFWQPISDTKITPSPEISIGKLTNRVDPWFDIISKPTCTDMFTIKANGKVVPCCLDVYEDIILGDMYKDSVHDIYHGKQLQILRENLSNMKNIPSCCKNCTYLPQFQSKSLNLIDRTLAPLKLLWRHINDKRGKPRQDV